MKVYVDTYFYLQLKFHGEPIDINIKRIIVHPKYNPPKKYNDIALIELDSKVEFGRVQPACLWSDSDISDLGSEGMLTGWGYTEHGKIILIFLNYYLFSIKFGHKKSKYSQSSSKNN